MDQTKPNDARQTNEQRISINEIFYHQERQLNQQSSHPAQQVSMAFQHHNIISPLYNLNMVAIADENGKQKEDLFFLFFKSFQQVRYFPLLINRKYLSKISLFLSENCTLKYRHYAKFIRSSTKC